MALCPSPCTHTHFPLHTDAAQLTRGQAAGVSKPPKARPGRKEGDLGAVRLPGLSIPLCLTSTAGTSHYLPDGAISRTNLYLQPLYPPSSFCRAIFNHQQTVFTFPSLPWENFQQPAEPISPFLEFQVPVGLSKMEKTSFLLLFHQRVVKRFTTWSFSPLLYPQKMALELRLRADVSAETLGKAK